MGSKPSTPAPVQPPPPTAEEIAIQKQQLELMKRQVQQLDAVEPLFRSSIEAQSQALEDQESLRPFVLEGMGLVEENGQLRRMTEEEFQASLSDVDRAARENTLLSLERDRKALLGELPLSVAGQQAKAKEFETFKEAMARAGHVITGDDPGSAIATTTPGIQALKAFNERFGLIEDAERRGQLDSASAAVLQRMGVATDIGASRRAGLLQFPGASTSANVNAPDFAGASRDFGGLLQPFQFTRNQQFRSQALASEQQFNANLQASANKSAAFGAILGTAGTLGAAGIIASKRSLKKNIRRASEREEDKSLEMVKDLKTYTYRYKGESGKAPRRMGLMVDEAPKAIVSDDRSGLDVGRTVGMLIGATRSMARKGIRRPSSGQ